MVRKEVWIGLDLDIGKNNPLLIMGVMRALRAKHGNAPCIYFKDNYIRFRETNDIHCGVKALFEIIKHYKIHIYCLF